MSNKQLLKTLFLISVFLFNVRIVSAGFGISPPYVQNEHLLPGSHYEQRISLSKSDVNGSLMAQIIVDAPEIEDWLSFEPSREFLFPEEEQQIWLTVKVDVPQDTNIGDYNGYLRIKTLSPETRDNKEGETVSVFLGARIDMNLTVVKNETKTFEIRSIKIPRVLQGEDIKLFLKIKNLGNIGSKLDRVHLDIYDNGETRLLESIDNTEIETIKAFNTKEIFVKMPTDLNNSQHWGNVKIYYQGKLLKEEKLFFTIGEIPNIDKTATVGDRVEQNLTNKKVFFYIGIVIFILIALIKIALINKKKIKSFFSHKS